MSIGKSIPVIMLCALLTSCTISQKGDIAETYEGTAPETESAGSMETAVYGEWGEAVLPGGYLENEDSLPGLPPDESYEMIYAPEPPLESWFWKQYPSTFVTNYPDLGGADQPSENAVKFLDSYAEEQRQSYPEAEDIQWHYGGYHGVPSKNGTFIINEYYVAVYSINIEDWWSEIYFVPHEGDPRLVLDIAPGVMTFSWIGGERWLFCVESHGNTIYRISEGGEIDTLTLPEAEVGSVFNYICDYDAAEGFTLDRDFNMTDEDGVRYTWGEVYKINGETLEIMEEQRGEPSPAYRWSSLNSNNSSSYFLNDNDPSFESMISDGARQYFEGEMKKAAANAPLTEKEEAEWQRIYTNAFGFSKNGGSSGYAVKTYGLYNIPDKMYYEIYYSEDGQNGFTLLRSMSGEDNNCSIWGTMCDGARLYFVYKGELCRVNQTGKFETVLTLDRYDGWELYRADTGFTGEGHTLRANLCYRSSDPETGAQLVRRDACAVNIETLKSTYIAGEITPA